MFVVAFRGIFALELKHSFVFRSEVDGAHHFIDELAVFLDVSQLRFQVLEALSVRLGEGVVWAREERLSEGGAHVAGVVIVAVIYVGVDSIKVLEFKFSVFQIDVLGGGGVIRFSC